MNFLLRSTTTQHVAAEQVSVQQESPADTSFLPKPASTLEGLIAEDPFPLYSSSDDRDGESDGVGAEVSGIASSGGKNDTSVVENHTDVSEEEGWITIPYRELPDNWCDAPDIQSLCSLDRPFVFPGEQIHVLACLSACKQDTEVITPFKVAAVMSRTSRAQSPEEKNENMEDKVNSEAGEGHLSHDGQVINQNGEYLVEEKIDLRKDISVSESLLRMEDHKRQTETLLHRFKNSHFFVRIAESSEPLWSKKSDPEMSLGSAEAESQKSITSGKKTAKNMSGVAAVIDKGDFDANLSGGVARNILKCCSLSNGDIVVLLQVNVGVDFLKDPVIEILQFEKYKERSLSSENWDNSVITNPDPCGELLKWLLPLDNTVPPPARTLSPPRLNSGSGIGSTHQKSASSGSQLFSFGHFRSYSMSSLPQSPAPPSAPPKAQSSKPTFDLENWDQYTSQKRFKGQSTGNEGLLSFRGVSLERERFSVRCGLEGIYVPGRRWRRKLEIIQPVEIHSFAADCNTDDLLCVQIKNVSPAHTPDIVLYIDAITIVFEEASKGGPSSPLPIACIEAGNDHSLPNLALRRGEEHSFILKPVPSLLKNLKAYAEKSSRSSSSSLCLPSKTFEGNGSSSAAAQYAVMLSCRCNYTESRLFFKQPTSWRPRISRDLMISVASEISGQSSEANEGVTQLPVQVLTLQASNLTSQELTLTVLAPTSFTYPPSVVSLNSSPTSPMSPFIGFSEFTGRLNDERHGTALHRVSTAPLVSESEKHNGDSATRSISLNKPSAISDVVPSSGLGCTHLWLQSRVPLGCVPAQSTATIKLELLPLTDGIITLDTLHIDAKEKGATYVPEHSLKINATTSISTGII